MLHSETCLNLSSLDMKLASRQASKLVMDMRSLEIISNLCYFIYAFRIAQSEVE